MHIKNPFNEINVITFFTKMTFWIFIQVKGSVDKKHIDKFYK